MKPEDIKEILESHKKWLIGDGGSRADLRGANLRGANLRGADLCGANIDFSVLSFSCYSLKCKTDEKQRIQIMFHALSWMAHAESITDEEKAIYNFALDYANKFHRADVGRLIKKED